jgi:RNA 2',3'-cyclic 3'-phosphodiesterase
MRLFLAIELPDGVKAHLLQVRATLERAIPKVAYTKPDNLHITLKFLGEVDPKRLPELTDSLGTIKPQTLQLQAAKLDCFPNKGPIRIIAADMDGSLPPLRALVQSIEQRCHYLGFEREQRAFRPHVTLARARPVLSQKFRPTIRELAPNLWPGPKFAPGDFVLMNSELSSQGSVYTSVARFSFSP